MAETATAGLMVLPTPLFPPAQPPYLHTLLQIGWRDERQKDSGTV